MKVLMLLPQVPYPPDQGAKMRNWGLVRILAQEHELQLLAFGDGPLSGEARQALARYCQTVQVVPASRRGRLERAARLALSPLPDMAFRLWSTEYAAALESLLGRERFEAVHVSNIELGLCLKLAKASRPTEGRATRVVFDDHNAEYLLQQRAYETEVRRGRPGPLALYSLLQARRLRRFEAETCRAADLVLAVSSEDARHLAGLGPGIEPVVVPNGVDADSYRALPPARQERPLLLFSGKLDYRPNQDALRWFADEVLPRIWRVRPDARLLVVGQAPPGWLVGWGQHDVRIVVTGAVPDDRPYLERCSAYVLPMRWGGGVRFKALVALASGRPLISTSMGVEGLGCVPGVHALVADEAETFAANAVRALEDETLAVSLAQAGRELVEQRFAWSRIAPKLLEAYRGLALATAERVG